MKFDRLGCFAYSQEEGTVAAKMENQLDEDTKQQRADSIMRIQTGIMAEKQAAMVGRTLRVLCDGLDEAVPLPQRRRRSRHRRSGLRAQRGALVSRRVLHRAGGGERRIRSVRRARK